MDGAQQSSMARSPIPSKSNGRLSMVVCNHVSFIEALTLKAFFPESSFTPKAEVLSMPLIGSVLRALGCFFLERRSNNDKEYAVQ